MQLLINFRICKHILHVVLFILFNTTICCANMNINSISDENGQEGIAQKKYANQFAQGETK